jgi:phosphatidylinositol glycan class B
LGFIALVLFALLVQATVAVAQSNVYIDALGSGWQDWSWSTSNVFNNPSPTYNGSAASIKVISLSAWNGFSLYYGSIASNAYQNLAFYINGGTTGGQLLKVVLEDTTSGQASAALNLESYLVGGGSVASGVWKQVSIPLADFHLHTSSFTRIDLQDRTGTAQPVYYLDSITLNQNQAVSPPPIMTTIRSASSRAVVAFFNMGLTGASASNAANYQLLSATDPNYTSRVTATSAQYDATQFRVALNFTSNFVNGARYTLYVNNVTNLTGAAIAADFSGSFGWSNHIVQVSALTSNHSISPLIYGVAWAPSTDYLRDIGASVHRWGGNRVSTYNWVANTSNAGSDWYFENSGNSSAMQFANDSAAAGAATLLSIPTLPFVAKDSTSVSFSVAKYGPQQTTDPYNANAGIGVGTNGQNIVNDPLDSGTTNTVTLQAQWLRNLLSNSVALPFLALDNEMDIWSGTHRDWHPAAVTYDEMWRVFTNYATMVRAESLASQILAPVSCCWWFYWNSAAGDSDKTAHGGEDFLPWFLDMAYAHELQTGQRLLDVLDIHYYPDSFSGGTDAGQQLRSTRELWDPTYTSEGWIGTDQWATQTQPNRNKPNIIPRFKTLIAQHYPGTKLALTEYNWGAETTLPGGLAQADVLGIFGREDLYLATRWTAPDAASPVYHAFKLYRNYDGNHSGFGDVSVFADAADPNLLTAYASKDSQTGDLLLIVVNKNPDFDYNAQIQFANYIPAPDASVWQVSAANPIAVLQEPDLTNASTTTSFVFPAYSATLLRFSALDSDVDGIPDWWMTYYFGHAAGLESDHSRAVDDADGDGFTTLQEFLAGTNPLDPSSALRITKAQPSADDFVITFSSANNRFYRVERCNDFNNGVWTTVADNVPGTGGPIQVVDPDAASQTQRFYRARLLP